MLIASKLLASATFNINGVEIRGELRSYADDEITATAQIRVNGVTWTHARETNQKGEALSSEWYRGTGFGDFRVTPPSEEQIGQPGVKDALRAVTRAMASLVSLR